METESWRKIVEKKRNELKSCIPQKWVDDTLKDKMAQMGYVNTGDFLDTVISEEEAKITNLTLVELAKKISDGELSALEVTEAYCHRTALVQQILNCCSEIFFDKAIERARKLDEIYKETGKVTGPLHGVPISLKDQVDLPGFDSAVGYVAMLNKPKTEMSLLAELLQDSGAVFYVKTTVPMAMMAPETDSNIYGYTSNACNINLSSGGSSGGEGALIGAKGSPLGFGTDIGGSIRIPATFQGLHALKPSLGRISYLRVTNSYCNQEAMPSVIGPMARSLKDIEFITKLIFDAGLWQQDPKVLPVSFQNHQDIKLSKLTFGLWKFDGKLSLNPPVARALKETIEALQKQGHEIVDFDLSNHDQIMDGAKSIYCADEGEEVEEICKLSGEPVVNCVTGMLKYHGGKPLVVNKWWDVCGEQYRLQQDFFNLWNSTAGSSKSGKKIDALIAPVWPSCSFSPGTTGTLNYTCPFNLFDCPGVIVPVTKVDKDLDPIDKDYKPLNKIDEEIYQSYSPEAFKGMPVCIQVLGRRLDDEKMLAVASVVELCIKSN